MSTRKVSAKKSRHRHLLSDPEVKRWYDNVARGSIITADVYLRRLGLFCEKNNITPKTLVEMDKASLTALALDKSVRNSLPRPPVIESIAQESTELWNNH